MHGGAGVDAEPRASWMRILTLRLIPRPREFTTKVWVTLHFRAFWGSKNSALKFETGDLGSSTTVGPDLITMWPQEWLTVLL